MLKQPFTFNGREFISFTERDKDFANHFSYQCIVLPDQQVSTVPTYLIAPIPVAKDAAGVGITMNGPEIRVVECSGNTCETILLIHVDPSDWLNLVLVYTDKQPSLYINGKLIAVGSKSRYQHVYPSSTIGGNEKGECFKGKIQGITFWRESLSFEAVQQVTAGQKVNAREIVWSRNFLTGIASQAGKPFYPKVTVIMPAYNKYWETMMTLHSLECQTFAKNDFEVIIADDGSSDAMIRFRQSQQFSFHITYIRSNQNIGRPKIRNLGIRNATGEIIVFLDAEIMVKPDFIFQHVAAHMEKEKRVVCGSLVLHGIFTKYDPKFSAEQKALLQSIARKQPLLRQHVPSVIKRQTPAVLLSEKQIYNQTFVNYSFEKSFVEIYRKTLFNVFGNEVSAFHFPWILFCTGNVSVRRAGIEQVGLFEEYPGYGWDDHEMGYRLYKKGYTFLNHTNLVTYHQEHPISPSNPHDALRNFVRVFRKYPEIEMRIFILHFLGIDLQALHEMLTAYQAFISRYPDQYLAVKSLFSSLLERASQKLWNGEKVERLTAGQSPQMLAVVVRELQELSTHPQFFPFSSRMQYLLTL